MAASRGCCRTSRRFRGSTSTTAPTRTATSSTSAIPRRSPAKIIHNFKRVIVAELNMGQLRMVLRAQFLIDCVGLNKIQGMPFKVAEVTAAIEKELGTAATKPTLTSHVQVNA